MVVKPLASLQSIADATHVGQQCGKAELGRRDQTQLEARHKSHRALQHYLVATVQGL